MRVRVGGGRGTVSGSHLSGRITRPRGEAKQATDAYVPARRAASLGLLETNLHCPCLGFRVQGLGLGFSFASKHVMSPGFGRAPRARSPATDRRRVPCGSGCSTAPRRHGATAHESTEPPGAAGQHQHALRTGGEGAGPRAPDDAGRSGRALAASVAAKQDGAASASPSSSTSQERVGEAASGAILRRLCRASKQVHYPRTADSHERRRRHGTGSNKHTLE